MIANATVMSQGLVESIKNETLDVWKRGKQIFYFSTLKKKTPTDPILNGRVTGNNSIFWPNYKNNTNN